MEKKEARLKELIIHELESLIKKIKNITKGSMLKPTDRIKILSLKTVEKFLPPSAHQWVVHFMKNKWFHKEQFYFIVDNSEMIGYLGMNLYEEPAPYGKYLFIYTLHLKSTYHHGKMIAYLKNFIETIAKKRQCLYVDIHSIASNLTDQQLKELGFLPFSGTYVIRGTIKKNIPSCRSPVIKKIDYNLSDLDGFFPCGRWMPMKFLFQKWEAKKESIQLYKLFLNTEKEPCRAIILEEKDKRKKQFLYQYNLLMKPVDLFDDPLVKKMYFQLLNWIREQFDKNEMVIYVPYGMQEVVQNVQCSAMKNIFWYRKIVS